MREAKFEGFPSAVKNKTIIFSGGAFYKIYDEKYIGNKINFINDLNELPLDADKDNTFVFIEDYTNNVYKEYDVSEFLDTRNIVN